VAALEAELDNSGEAAKLAAAETSKQLAAKQAEADELAATLAAAKRQIAEQVRLLIGMFTF